MLAIHHSAKDGFSAKADVYVTGRPGYPLELVDWLRGDLGLSAGKTVIDLGAGTGKFLPTLQATGATPVAVEPVDAMRTQLIAHNAGVEAKEGSADHIPMPDASVDAVVCAQSFHWFSTREALAEIRRVLKPGGSLGLIWNTRAGHVDWVRRISTITRPYEADTPSQHTGAWRKLFPADGFGPPSERTFAFGHKGPPERVIVDRVLSTSYIAALPSAVQQDVVARVREVIATTPELMGQAEVSYPYDTLAFCCKKV